MAKTTAASRPQADGRADGSELGAHPAFEGLEVGCRGEVDAEPGFEPGDRRIEIDFRRRWVLLGADRLVHHRHGGFRLALVEASIAKALRGGAGIEGGGGHGEARVAEAAAARRGITGTELPRRCGTPSTVRDSKQLLSPAFRR